MTSLLAQVAPPTVAVPVWLATILAGLLIAVGFEWVRRTLKGIDDRLDGHDDQLTADGKSRADLTAAITDLDKQIALLAQRLEKP